MRRPPRLWLLMDLPGRRAKQNRWRTSAMIDKFVSSGSPRVASGPIQISVRYCWLCLSGFKRAVTKLVVQILFVLLVRSGRWEARGFPRLCYPYPYINPQKCFITARKPLCPGLLPLGGTSGRLALTGIALSRIGFLGETTWEGARDGRARRATIMALPAALHHPRPYGLTSTFPKILPMRAGTAPLREANCPRKDGEPMLLCRKSIASGA